VCPDEQLLCRSALRDSCVRDSALREADGSGEVDYQFAVQGQMIRVVGSRKQDLGFCFLSISCR